MARVSPSFGVVAPLSRLNRPKVGVRLVFLLVCAIVVLASSAHAAQPPADDERSFTNVPPMSGRVVIVLSSSGTMTNNLNLLRDFVLVTFLDRPDATIKLNILCFADDKVFPMAPESLAMSEANVAKVKAFCYDTLKPSGSTSGLSQAVTAAANERPNTIIVIGGENLDESKNIGDLTRTLTGSGAKVLVMDSSVGGNDFLKSLAEKTKGTYLTATKREVANKPEVSKAVPADVSPKDIADYRQAKLTKVRAEIEGLAKLVALLPQKPDRPETKTEQKLKTAKNSEAAILAQSDVSLAAEIRELRASAAADAEQQRLAAERQRQTEEQAKRQSEQEQQAALEAQKQQEAERQQAIARVLAKKWPGWEGPWKQCRVCDGTGRDAIAERAENQRRASAMASQNIGSGVVRRIPGVFIACDFCGGTGVIPDQR